MGHRFDVSNGHSVNVMRCPGDLSASHMVQMKAKLRRLVNRKRRFFLLDLSQAKHVELAGLGILVDRIKQVRSLRGDIRLFNIRPEVFETLRMVGLTHVINTFQDEEEARRSFQIA
ncbi:MAG: hypothetical protein A3J52_02735 [Omnitrophica bacterium RIFCSPHIGHO2_02_FULL_49_9]|nr:MAG: hypothetical protein A3J52_02735 [Omnitrophica bacterium RIFCSPHIGHO2_02_FULL_49_9]OGW89739.1 MAG: hypothetical protein A3A73_04610 [Omnitrophica bacterium RIFCSPLOWO2_01_FULL_50_24]